MDRPGLDARRAVEAVLSQNTTDPFELIVVTPDASVVSPNPAVLVLVEADRNPALRRNLAAARARGEILAFIDDDAFASPDWLSRGAKMFDENPDLVALGGPDPAPEDSTVGELFSETVLATPYIGSGIVCHESRPGTFPIHAPHDIALVNLFVRKSRFEAVGGFDTAIGYIGEDTDLISRLTPLGEVLYSDSVLVRHRRRSFPLAYLRQRWRYRLRTGELLVRGKGSYRKSGKIWLFLIAVTGSLAISILFPAAALLLAMAYILVTAGLAIPKTKLSAAWWPLIPPAFLLHHATYFLGILTGAARALAASRPNPDNE